MWGNAWEDGGVGWVSEEKENALLQGLSMGLIQWKEEREEEQYQFLRWEKRWRKIEIKRREGRGRIDCWKICDSWRKWREEGKKREEVGTEKEEEQIKGELPSKIVITIWPLNSSWLTGKFQPLEVTLLPHLHVSSWTNNKKIVISFQNVHQLLHFNPSSQIFTQQP